MHVLNRLAALPVLIVLMHSLVGCASPKVEAPEASGDEFSLYFLAGQSNMTGFGTCSELADSQRGPVDQAFIYHTPSYEDGSTDMPSSVWSPVECGFGEGFDADQSGVRLSDRFGPELELARTLRALRPNEKIAIVKYSRNGTSLDDRAAVPRGTWDLEQSIHAGVGETTNQLDHAMRTLQAATTNADVNGDGRPDRLVPKGIVWMQGESDATNEATAADYAENLKAIMAVFREALGDQTLPVVIGRISDSGVRNGTERVWPFGDELRANQRAFVQQDANASLVITTDGYGFSDPYHYDTPGFLDLGARFGESMHLLRDQRE